MKAELFPGDKHAVFHACRHTAATMMANNVQLPTVIQKWLGHKDANDSSLRAYRRADAAERV